VANEESQQRLIDWAEKKSQRCTEFATRILVMATKGASEVKEAAPTVEVTTNLELALDIAFERRQEAILKCSPTDEGSPR
jgi:hypothetical protein